MSGDLDRDWRPKGPLTPPPGPAEAALSRILSTSLIWRLQPPEQLATPPPADAEFPTHCPPASVTLTPVEDTPPPSPAAAEFLATEHDVNSTVNFPGAPESAIARPDCTAPPVPPAEFPVRPIPSSVALQLLRAMAPPEPPAEFPSKDPPRTESGPEQLTACSAPPCAPAEFPSKEESMTAAAVNWERSAPPWIRAELPLKVLFRMMTICGCSPKTITITLLFTFQWMSCRSFPASHLIGPLHPPLLQER